MKYMPPTNYFTETKHIILIDSLFRINEIKNCILYIMLKGYSLLFYEVRLESWPLLYGFMIYIACGQISILLRYMCNILLTSLT